MCSASEGTPADAKGAPRNAKVSAWSSRPRYRAPTVQREITLTQLFCWMLALLASVAALVWASMMLLSDHEQPGTIFATGGLALLFWSAFHLTDRPSHSR